MASYTLDNGIIHKKDGSIAGRLENNSVCDQYGETFLVIKGNIINNSYGSMIAKVEKGQILSASGGILGKISEARLCFDNSNSLPDVDIAAMWLPFVKGIK